MTATPTHEPLTLPRLELGRPVRFRVGDALVRTLHAEDIPNQYAPTRTRRATIKRWTRTRDARVYRSPRWDPDAIVAGIVTGLRYLSDGEREWLGEEEGYAFVPHVTRPVYLVTYGLHRDPARILEGDLILAPLPTRPAVTLELPVTPCPECRAGKHGNCDGTTWDEAADDVTVCPCAASDREAHA